MSLGLGFGAVVVVNPFIVVSDPGKKEEEATAVLRSWTRSRTSAYTGHISVLKHPLLLPFPVPV